ncbi:MAG: hypothetical protein ACTHN5_05345 [Phycisphaerae bacterium]
MMIFSAEYWAVFVWGVVVLASWVGWGELVRRVAGVSVGRVGWAMKAGWGMAAVLGICGFLEWAGIGDQVALVIVVLAGVIVWGLDAWNRQRQWMAGMRETRWAAYVPVIVLLVYCYATSVVAFDYNWWDDLPNYLVYVKKILATGTLMEPFSLRRLLTYGGQQTLQGMVIAAGNFLNADVVELGLGRILFARLLLEMVRPAGKRAVWGGAIVVFLLLLVPHVPATSLNTHSEMTGVVLMVVLVQTLGMAGSSRETRMAGLIGVIVAAICTLRVSYFPAAILPVGLFYLLHLAARPSQWKAYVGNLVVALGCAGILLLPWALMLYRSNGTLLYPLWHGDARPEYAYFNAGLSSAGTVKWVVGFLGYPMGLVLMLPLALAEVGRFRRVELPVAIGVVLSVVMTLMSFTLTEYVHIYRYVFPLVFAIAAVLLVRAVVQRRSVLLRVVAWGMVAGIGVLNVAPGCAWLFGERGKVWTAESASPLGAVVGSEKAYRAAQGAVPPGERIFSATSFPVLFDFARNPIWIADVPGAVSPGSGMPIFEGAGAVARYLKGLGVSYVVFTFPEEDRTLYSKAYWEPIFSGERKALPDEVQCSRYNVAFIRCMEGMPEQGEVVYRSRTLCVVKLR